MEETVKSLREKLLNILLRRPDLETNINAVLMQLSNMGDDEIVILRKIE